MSAGHQTQTPLHRLWHMAREYLTHWFIAGVIVTLISYTSTHSSKKPAEWADYSALSNLGLALTIVGAVLFLVMSLRRYLRYWLIRLIYEQRDQADRIVGGR